MLGANAARALLFHPTRERAIRRSAAVGMALVGVSRYAREPGSDRAECAIVVADAWQGRGLGTELMRSLVREGYTRPERLGISGGSNGGLLVGAGLLIKSFANLRGVDSHGVVRLPHYAARLRNGNPGMVIVNGLAYGDEAWASHQGRPVAVGIYRGGELHPTRVFNL